MKNCKVCAKALSLHATACRFCADESALRKKAYIATFEARVSGQYQAPAENQREAGNVTIFAKGNSRLVIPYEGEWSISRYCAVAVSTSFILFWLYRFRNEPEVMTPTLGLLSFFLLVVLIDRFACVKCTEIDFDKGILIQHLGALGSNFNRKKTYSLASFSSVYSYVEHGSRTAWNVLKLKSETRGFAILLMKEEAESNGNLFFARYFESKKMSHIRKAIAEKSSIFDEGFNGGDVAK